MLEAPSGAEERHAPLASEADAGQRALEAAIGCAWRCPEAVERGEGAGPTGGDSLRRHPLESDCDAEPPPAILERRAGLAMGDVGGVVVPDDADPRSAHRPDSIGRAFPAEAVQCH